MQQDWDDIDNRSSFNENLTDELIFDQEEEPQPDSRTEVPLSESRWKILIVDDEIDVHHITQLALRDFVFENKFLTFISAYNAQEARRLIQLHPDIAVILLDVVMETEDAGLKLVKSIREELNNPLVRIILRTGQPGRAPEDYVAFNYGIDDYKTKTELTASKLFITIVTALRAYSTFLQVLEMVHQPKEALLDSKTAELRQEYAGTIGQLIASLAETIEHPLEPAGDSYAMSTITRIAKTVLRTTEEHFAKLGTSQTKFDALTFLNNSSGKSASPSEIAKHCCVSRAAMTGLLDNLEQEGYVERETHPCDRRALTVKLTSQGAQFLAWVTPQDHYHLSDLMEALDEVERKKLVELASKAIKLGKYPKISLSV